VSHRYSERCPSCGNHRLLFPYGLLRLCIDCVADRKRKEHGS